MTRSEAFQGDPRVLQAKQLVLEALKAHQSALKGPQPPRAELKVSFEALLEEFHQLRGGGLWHPYLGSGFGRGALVELLDGSVKYDFISGIGTHILGHSHPDLVSASFEAALSDVVMEGNLQQNGDALELCRKLSQLSGLPHCFLSSSGAMANENALKLAFQKNFPASRILAFEHCFAGRTLATSQITDKPHYREGLPLNLFVDYLPYFDPQAPEESLQKCLKALKETLARYPGQHAILILEPVQGEGGFYPGSHPFFKGVIEEAKKHHIAIFADEVQSFGRTPSPFCFQHFGLEGLVDLVAVGKVSQACATLFTEEYAPRPGLLSQTFTASVSAIRAALVILEKMTRGNFYGPQGRINQIYTRFETHFEAMSRRHSDKISGPKIAGPKIAGPKISGPWGLGAMIAFTPGSGTYEEAKALCHKLFEAGLITFINGSSPTRIRLLPPALVLTDEEIDDACRIIESCL